VVQSRSVNVSGRECMARNRNPSDYRTLGKSVYSYVAFSSSGFVHLSGSVRELKRIKYKI
jgi:hypothetical protein